MILQLDDTGFLRGSQRACEWLSNATNYRTQNGMIIGGTPASARIDIITLLERFDELGFDLVSVCFSNSGHGRRDYSFQHKHLVLGTDGKYHYTKAYMYDTGRLASVKLASHPAILVLTSTI